MVLPTKYPFFKWNLYPEIMRSVSVSSQCVSSIWAQTKADAEAWALETFNRPYTADLDRASRKEQLMNPSQIERSSDDRSLEPR